MTKAGQNKVEKAEPQLPQGVTSATIRDIARRHGARNIRVFGSRVGGMVDADSDIDLLVDFESGRDLFDLIALKQDLEAYTRLRVDVLTERALSPFIRDEVLRKAIAL